MKANTDTSAQTATDATVDLSWRRYFAPPLHEEGPRFIAVFALVTVITGWLWWPLGVLGVILTVWCVSFFRDPARAIPCREGLIVSPASGVVQMIHSVAPPPELEIGDTPLTRISVFMSVFDCHVNRIPVEGTIAKQVYCPGRFFNASLDKASKDNERNIILLTLKEERSIVFVQIAGLIARRIRSDLAVGQTVSTGEKFGLIRFGSRLDVYLPPGVSPLVIPGQICISGETVLADLTSNEPPRPGNLV